MNALVPTGAARKPHRYRYNLNFAAGKYHGGTPTVVRNSDAWAKDSSGTWSKFDPNVLARTDLGLRVHSSRTNSFRNNSCQNAVVGTPGTYPDFHTSVFPLNGLALDVVGLGIESGLEYIDLRLHGTASGAGSNVAMYLFDGTQQIAALNTERWIMSAFLTKKAGSNNGLTLLNLRVDQRNSGGGALSSTTTSILTLADGVLGNSRFRCPVTFNQATAAFVSGGLYVSYSNGAAVDITIRIAREQMEKGSAFTLETSPIRTVNAAVTRAADLPSMPVTWSDSDYVTITGMGTPEQQTISSVLQYLAALDDGTTGNVVGIARFNGTAAAWAVMTAGPAPQTLTAWAQDAIGTLQLAVQDGYGVATFNGVTTAPQRTTGFPKGLTTLHIGCAPDGTSHWNGVIQQITVTSSPKNYFIGVGHSFIGGSGDGGDDTQSWWYALANAMTPTRVYSNQGVAGQTSRDIKTRFLANFQTWPHWNDPNTFWIFQIGYNNEYEPAQVLSDLADMLTALRAALTFEPKFLVLSESNGDQAAPDQYFDNTGWENIVNGINAVEAAIYGERYVDTRSMWIAAYNSGDPTDTLYALTYKAVPPSLRADYIHPNPAAQVLEKNQLLAKVRALGWSA